MKKSNRFGSQRKRYASDNQLRYILWLSRQVGGCPVHLSKEMTQLEASWLIDALRKQIAMHREYLFARC